ncbi:MAG: hypothetical protein ACJ72C_02540, partial [Nitrososphaeraceae archaeon]
IVTVDLQVVYNNLSCAHVSASLLLLLDEFKPLFGSRGVSALDTMKPATAPMTITGKRSVCRPNSPSKRANLL